MRKTRTVRRINYQMLTFYVVALVMVAGMITNVAIKIATARAMGVL